MSFEDFDKKIKDAADRHHPAYDEQAWTKMEKLLNKHLPQKEDDRRRFLFIILFFLGLAGGGMLIFKPWKKDSGNTVIAADHTKTNANTEEQAPPGNAVPGNTKKEDELIISRADSNYLMPGDAEKKGILLNPGAKAPKPVITINGATVGGEPVRSAQPGTDKNNKKAKTNTLGAVKPIRSPKPVQNSGDLAVEKTDNNNKIAPDKPIKSDPVNPMHAVVDAAIDQKKQQVGDRPVANAVIDKPVNTPVTDLKKDEPDVANNKEKKTKDKKKKASHFFFSLSAGPDLSFVNNNKAGDVKLLAGAGIGYTFKDRFTLRTGFYSARKVYTATADAYDPPASFFALYPYLEKVDANCKVYEIPLSVSYNFGKNASRNWFVSAGLSTFLMKEETYNYHYKYTPTGNTYTNKWTIKDDNSHFFSVATISGGYKKDIGKRVTVMAEPYFKLPLGGVGYGKVKLNSGGVLFTVGVKPF